MPGGDRTGPMGMGPRTGWATGYCSGLNMPGYANPGAGRGFGLRRGLGAGRGRGGGRGFGGGRCFGRGGKGWRNMYWATGQPGWMRLGDPGTVPFTAPTKESEKQFLQTQAENLQLELEEIKKRLDELTAKE